MRWVAKFEYGVEMALDGVVGVDWKITNGVGFGVALGWNLRLILGWHLGLCLGWLVEGGGRGGNLDGVARED